jgi:hypothetical protein
VGNTEVFAGVGEPNPWLFAEQKKEEKSVVDRRYWIRGSGFALRSRLLHRRSLPPSGQVFANPPHHDVISK